MPVRDDRKPAVSRLLKIQTDRDSQSNSYGSMSEVTASPRLGVLKSWDNTPNYWTTLKSGMRSVVRWRKGHPIVSYIPTKAFLGPNHLSYQRISAGGTMSIENVPVPYGFDLPGGPWTTRKVWFGDVLAIGSGSVPEPEVPNHLIGDWEMVLKARSALSDGRTWNSLVFTAELGKATDMIVDAAKRLVMSIRALRRMDFARVDAILGVRRPHRRLTDSLANNWMAYKYGWMPLLKDVYDASRALSSYREGLPTPARPQRLVVRLRRRSAGYTHCVLQQTPSLVAHGRCIDSESRRLTLEWYVSNPAAYAAGALGMSNPVAFAWEVLPYSWIADWFAPIGEYANSLSALDGVSIGRSFIGTKRSTSFATDSLVADAEFNGPSFCDYTWDRLSVERRIDFPLALQLPDRIPIQLNLSAARLATSAALVHTAFRR